MDNPIGHSHLISLALVVAASTFIASWNAEKRRGWLRMPYRWDTRKVSLVVGQSLVAICFFFVPALIVTIMLWIVDLPKEITDEFEMHRQFQASMNRIMQTSAQLATLFSVGANFADLASTYGRTNFWKHMRQYLVAVVPAYLVIMGAASLGAQALALIIHDQTASAWLLFTLPILSARPTLNLVLVASLLFACGAVSYLIRKRGENLGGTD